MDKIDKHDKEFEAYLRQFRLRLPGSPPEIAAVSRRNSMRWLLVAAVLVLTVGITAVFVRNDGSGSGPKATVEAAGSPSMYRAGESIEAGQAVRSNSAKGLVLALEDGSRVEMREQSELKLESADDGIRVRLNDGSIVVTAAKQVSGHHLYVQTRDAVVSVVGTVFLVTAEQSGTSVAVVEGEVHVQQGAALKKLHPGEQVVTNPSMQMKPVAEQISWSRRAAEYVALLQQPPEIVPPSSAPVAAGQAAPSAALPVNNSQNNMFDMLQRYNEAYKPKGKVLPFNVVQSNYVRVTDDEVRTLITAQFMNRDLAFRDEAEGKRARIHIEGTIFRADNRRVSDFSRDLGVEFDSNTLAAILDKPTLFQETILLPPGRYKLHITAEDMNAQSIGVKDIALSVPSIPAPFVQSAPARITSGKQIFERECTSCHNADVATRMESSAVPLSSKEQSVLSFVRDQIRAKLSIGLARNHPEVIAMQQSIAELEARELGVTANYIVYISRHLRGFGKTPSTEEVPILASYLYEETGRRLEQQGPPQPVQPTDKDAPKENPDVAGARILNTACTTCHDLSAVTGKKEDRASWERIINGMVGYGAGLKDAEIPVLADYLFRHYGPPKEAPKAPEPVPSDTPLQPLQPTK